ncbi:hypothetical protein F5B20DRAFT_425493 [Whalleya microplaca]|nr:hypothetical protein F5B20DRAFT_425493 [Whalleya microplaca]
MADSAKLNDLEARWALLFNKDTPYDQGLTRVGVVDYDQRRDYFLVGPKDQYGLDINDTGGQLEATRRRVYQAVEKYKPLIAPNTRTIIMDRKRFVDLSELPPIEAEDKYEETFTLSELYFPSLKSSPFQDSPTVCISALQEVDRLGPGKDLVAPTGNLEDRVLFHYGLTQHARDSMLNQIKVLTSIPPHQNVLPLNEIVVHDTESPRIIGFTTQHIVYTSPVFKLKWLGQLIDTLNFLHFDMGIVHGDIKPKNLQVDPATDDLLLTNFGKANSVDNSKDTDIDDELKMATWALYHIVTRDIARSGPPRDRLNTKEINDMRTWPVKTTLDCETSTLRNKLYDWLSWRESRGVTFAKDPIVLPWRKQCYSPAFSKRFLSSNEAENGTSDYTRPHSRPSMPYNISWQRPPYATAYADRASDNMVIAPEADRGGYQQTLENNSYEKTSGGYLSYGYDSKGDLNPSKSYLSFEADAGSRNESTGFGPNESKGAPNPVT